MTVIDRRDPDTALGERAQRTRDAILDTAHGLFLRYGYRGTRIDDITSACGISRAGFYTYFATKQDVFVALGTSTYRAITAIVAAFGRLPSPCTVEDLRGWVSAYFATMDRHGAFLLSAEQTGPDDDPAFSTRVRALHLRTTRRLGRMVAERRAADLDAAATGLAVTALLDRSWFLSRSGEVAVDADAAIDAATDLLAAYLGCAPGS